MTRFVTAAALAATTLFALAAPAFAHVTLETPQAAIGSTYKAVLRIGHGCGTEATHTLRVEIPEGFYNVKPMPKAGWTLQTVTGPYAQPFDNHGTVLKEGVKEIVWSGGDLPDAFYDEFVFRGTFAGAAEPGPFYFPTVQECASGKEEWTDVSGAAGSATPAPMLTLVAASAGGHDEHAGHGAAAAPEVSAAPVTVGDIEITGAFTRATLPNAPVGGGFFTITNKGKEDDRLVSAQSSVAKDTQIHEMKMEGDVMKMRQLADGLVIPAGQSVELTPSGYHLMFMGLNAPIAEGDTVAVTLTFEKAGTAIVNLTAAGTAADAPAGHMGH